MPKVARGELAHLPGAEEQRPSTAEAAELPRGEIHRRRSDRFRHLREPCLRPYPLPRAQGVFEETVQERPGRAGGQGSLVGEAHLPEDLRLPRHERVEPGGDPEEVLDGLFVLPGREHVFELQPRAPFELLANPVRVTAGQ